ncbi:MAG: zinc ribbon domain-containing protein [Bacilli bacterium]|nr:zinc ribbon domain-containing protein [Bacilli bacterium]
MNCSKCGAVVDNNSKFCTSCGNSIIQNNQQNNVNTNPNVNVQPVNQNYNNNVNPNMNVQPVNQNFNYNNMNNPQVNYSQNVQVNEQKKTSAGMIVGIVALVINFIFGILAVPVAIVGLIMSITEKNTKGKIAGIIINILGIIIPIGLLLISFVAVNDYIEKAKEYSAGQVFKGDGYQLTCDGGWTYNPSIEKDGLVYSFAEDSYLYPIDKKDLSSYSCDFSDIGCKDEIYDDYYNVWSNDLKNDSLSMFKDSYGLMSLTDDSYYGTYNYGVSEANLSGTYFIVISEKDNAIFTFYTKTSRGAIIELLANDAMRLFKTLEVTDN